MKKIHVHTAIDRQNINNHTKFRQEKDAHHEH